METLAVVLEQPEKLRLSRLDLPVLAPGDVAVDVRWSGISTGTERLLWSGRMPPFPGMGYPLVPGYETVGIVTAAGEEATQRIGDAVFVSGARCYGEIRGLFGGAASRLVVPSEKAYRIGEALGEQGVLLALAATAHHAMRAASDSTAPELIVGHGVLGRLLARLVVASGARPPVVWEADASRRPATGMVDGYAVLHPDQDKRRNYRCVCDMSGDSDILDAVIERLSPQGEIVLAGFYADPLHFQFPPAFMREARISIAAEWVPEDLRAVIDMTDAGTLPLDGLITHRTPASDAESAYQTAFNETDCLKMVLDWRDLS